MDGCLGGGVMVGDLLLQPTFHHIPVDVLEEGFYVIGSFQPVISHEGMLKDVHYQDWLAAGKVIYLMLIYPLVKKPASYIILIKYRPADAT